jgi:hypothetical protein
MIEPGESAFDNPTSWQNSEALLVVGTQDNFKTNAAIFSNPLQELTAVAAVHPDETQLLAGAAQASEQETSAIAVLDRGCRNNHRQQQPHGVNQDVPLRTIDLLACVIPSGATERCRLNTLAVQAASRWVLVTPVSFSHLCPQGVMDSLPGAVIAPLPKVGVDALPLGILFREHPPLDATNCNIQDCVDDQPHVQGSVSPLVEIQYRPLRPEIQAFALQKCHFAAAFAGYFRGLCSVYAVFRCWFGIVKSFTEFQPNKIHYLSSVRGRPPDLASGINGWIISHWLSVRSVGYRCVLINTAYTTV